jgi:phytoene dehydrogenase-like protein
MGMPDVTIVDETVIIRLSALERIAGLLRDVAVPVSSVRDAHVAPDGLRAARGIRAPGLHLPGVNKYGTWRSSRGKTYVAVKGRRPALVLALEGHAYERIVVTTADAEALLHQLRTA